jgi:hypothetical protein
LIAQKQIDELKTIFEIDVQGDLQDYLGIQIQSKDGSLHMSQRHLIDSILQDLSLLDKNGAPHSKVTTKDLPSMISRKITADTNRPPFTYTWNYHALIGKLNYLEKSTRLDISYVVHQLAR